MELKMYNKYFIIRSQRLDLHKMCAYGCIEIHSDVELLNLLVSSGCKEFYSSQRTEM